jgi:hypothetical protein
MNSQQRRTLQHTRTSLAPADVLAAAKQFFSRRNSIYAAYPEKEGPTFVSLRGQGGEEVIVGAAADDEGTVVTGSSYLFDQQIARFFATLPPYPTEDATTGPEDEANTVADEVTPDAAPAAGSAA